MQETNVRGHFTCLSSFEGIKQIREAKQAGLNISADTAMHQLHLSEMDLIDFNANCHLYPPLRSLRDKEALLQAIDDGTIDALCSDHRPLDKIAKLAPFGESVPGLSAIDTFLALGLHLVEQKKCDLHALLGAMTYRAAQLFGLPGGTLSKGADADVCIVDPHQYWTVQESTMQSKGKNTPFKGWQLPGIVTHTLLKGNIVHKTSDAM
ncbi:MAG: dihydroorotase family protein [Candidatus Berkiella sp.]